MKDGELSAESRRKANKQNELNMYLQQWTWFSFPSREGF